MKERSLYGFKSVLSMSSILKNRTQDSVFYDFFRRPVVLNTSCSASRKILYYRMVRGPRGSARRLTVAFRRTPRHQMPTSSRLLPSCSVMRNSSIPNRYDVFNESRARGPRPAAPTSRGKQEALAYCWERLSGCAGTPTCPVTVPRERLSGSDGRMRSAGNRSRVRSRSLAERSGSRRKSGPAIRAQHSLLEAKLAPPEKD